MRSPGGWPIRATLICVLQTAAVAAVPASSPEHRAVSPVNSADSACVGTVAPRINRHVAATVRSKIEAGFRLAVQRVQQVPSCHALFAEFGADGVDILSTTLYYRAELKMEMRVCPHAYAYTLVRGAPTWMCRRFAGLSDERAAAVLLHEALHHAGRDEWPHDRQGVSASAINALVEESCGF